MMNKENTRILCLAIILFIAFHVVKAVLVGMKQAADMRARRYQEQHPIYTELLKLAPLLLLAALLAFLLGGK